MDRNRRREEGAAPDCAQPLKRDLGKLFGRLFRVRKSVEDVGGPKIARKVRGDLLAGCKLLKSLGGFISVGGGSPSAGGIVVAAPHHAPRGTPLSAGHDVDTGPVAERLAGRLKGKFVVASELRSFVDVNKSPSEMEQAELGHHPGRAAFRHADMLLKLYYQSQVSVNNPMIVVEIHGHVGGNLDIEVSSGFPLRKDVRQDKALIIALQAFRDTLTSGLEGCDVFARHQPSVGVYPLDLDVKFTARGTHTFQKIEKLRELGVNAAGLHIEIHERLRPSPTDEGALNVLDGMITCLAQAIKQFAIKAGKPANFEFKDYLFEDFMFERGEAVLLRQKPFVLQQIPRDMVGQDVAVLSGRDLARLGLQDRQKIVLSKSPEFLQSLELQVTTADPVEPDGVGIAKKFRDQLLAKRGDKLYVGVKERGCLNRMALGFVSDIVSHGPKCRVAVGTSLLHELKELSSADEPIAISAETGEGNEVEITVAADLPHDKAVILSEQLARELNVTYADLVCFSTTTDLGAGGKLRRWMVESPVVDGEHDRAERKN